MDTKEENPTFSRRLQSRIAVHKAPDWLRKPTLPGRAIVLAKVEQGELQQAVLLKWLTESLTRADDRALFDLAP